MAGGQYTSSSNCFFSFFLFHLFPASFHAIRPLTPPFLLLFLSDPTALFPITSTHSSGFRAMWAVSRKCCSYKQKCRYCFCSFPAMTSEPQHQYNNEASVGFVSHPNASLVYGIFFVVVVGTAYGMHSHKLEAASKQTTAKRTSHKQTAFIRILLPWDFLSNSCSSSKSAVMFCISQSM